jgi:AcrR family transcriptional regulator
LARKPKPVQVRDAVATRARILAAATAEFAAKGMLGARVDAIAERSGANKRMIYHYFGSKEALFTAVLEASWSGIREAEQELHLHELPPREALEKLVRFTWSYYLNHPEFLTLVHSENLHKAKHLKGSAAMREMSDRFNGMVSALLKRGVDEGVFRPGIDPAQLNITIAAIGYYYLTNRYTGSIVYDRDLMTPAALDARLDFNIETIMRLVQADLPNQTPTK